jgi:ketosteroid isomerase-like protein
MTANKTSVQTYIDGFVEGDHAKILDCLTDDVSWEMPGFFSRAGKEAFDAEIENEGFVGGPKIEVLRMIEEDDVVVAEGTVTHARTSGSPLMASFCDVFHMENGKIKRLTSYLMQVRGV